VPSTASVIASSTKPINFFFMVVYVLLNNTCQR
jgi:hypothetical protein